MLKYTICFIRKNNQILLLNRNKKPNMGMWNGVGGKIEKNETPYEAIIRETLEETGIKFKQMNYAGKVTWKSNRGNAGMYVFFVDLPKEGSYNIPIKVEEGLLDWKDIDWILDPLNSGVVDNVKMYLPKIMAGEYGIEHRFIYQDGKMLDYSVETLKSVDLNGGI